MKRRDCYEYIERYLKADEELISEHPFLYKINVIGRRDVISGKHNQVEFRWLDENSEKYASKFLDTKQRLEGDSNLDNYLIYYNCDELKLDELEAAIIIMYNINTKDLFYRRILDSILEKTKRDKENGTLKKDNIIMVLDIFFNK